MKAPAHRTCHDRTAVPVPRNGQLARSSDLDQAKELCSAVPDAKLKALLGITPQLGIMTEPGKPAICAIDMIFESSTKLNALLFIVNLDTTASFDQYKVPTTTTYAGHKANTIAYGSAGQFQGLAQLSLNKSSAVKGVLGIQTIRDTSGAETSDTTLHLEQTYLGELAAALL